MSLATYWLHSRYVLGRPFYQIGINPIELIWADFKQEFASKDTTVFRNRISGVDKCMSQRRTPFTYYEQDSMFEDAVEK